EVPPAFALGGPRSTETFNAETAVCTSGGGTIAWQMPIRVSSDEAPEMQLRLLGGAIGPGYPLGADDD
ncbi:MAG TPA: hypothetical protein VI197_23955, partial [Polyangiaceae bacterium]